MAPIPTYPALLPMLLSLIAGGVDVVSFIGLGLFTSHITGNLVIMAARIVAGHQATLAHLISVPVFVAAIVATRLLAGGLEKLGVGALRPLLLLQLVALCAFLAVCLADPRADRNAPVMIFAAMLGVGAMAVQNALVQISLAGSPSTAVMTTNTVRFAVHIGDILLAATCDEAKKSAEHAWRNGAAILGFIAGCSLGALAYALVGFYALALPAGVAFLALVVALVAEGATGANPTMH